MNLGRREGLGKQGAPYRNKNRTLPEGQHRRGKNMNISMPYEEWQRFMRAVDLCEGHACTDEEYLTAWRVIDRAARRQFIEFWHARGVTDPAEII